MRSWVDAVGLRFPAFPGNERMATSGHISIVLGERPREDLSTGGSYGHARGGTPQDFEQGAELEQVCWVRGPFSFGGYGFRMARVSTRSSVAAKLCLSLGP